MVGLLARVAVRAFLEAREAQGVVAASISLTRVGNPSLGDSHGCAVAPFERRGPAAGESLGGCMSVGPARRGARQTGDRGGSLLGLALGVDRKRTKGFQARIDLVFAVVVRPQIESLPADGA
jgi:hypothetical protein